MAGGGFVAQWSGDGLWAQIFDARGVALRPAFEIDPLGNASGVTSLPNGGFVSICIVRDQGVVEGTFGQQYDAAGNAVGGTFRVDQPDAGFLDVSSAPNAVTTLTNGDVAVSWTDGQGNVFANIIPTGFHATASGAVNQLVTLSTIGAALNDTDGSETKPGRLMGR